MLKHRYSISWNTSVEYMLEHQAEYMLKHSAEQMLKHQAVAYADA